MDNISFARIIRELRTAYKPTREELDREPQTVYINNISECPFLNSPLDRTRCDQCAMNTTFNLGRYPNITFKTDGCVNRGFNEIQMNQWNEGLAWRAVLDQRTRNMQRKSQEAENKRQAAIDFLKGENNE